MAFALTGADQTLVFTPHYRQHTSRYGVSFVLQEAGTVEEIEDGPVYAVIDSLPVADDQYEFSHNLQGASTGTGMHLGVNYRRVNAGRWFTIEVDGTVLADVTLENVNPGDFYNVYYPIPAEMVEGRGAITVTFRADKGGYAGNIFETLSVMTVAE